MDGLLTPKRVYNDPIVCIVQGLSHNYTEQEKFSKSTVAKQKP